MRTINVYEAKASFNGLLSRVEAGETIVIARNGSPIAELGPLRTPHRPVVFGDLRGAVRIHDGFDSWGDQDEHDWFGGE